MPQKEIRPPRAGHNPKLRHTARAELTHALALQIRDSTIAELAREHDLQRSTVRTLLSEAGVRHQRALIGYSDTELAEALAARYVRGETVRQLSYETGLDWRKVTAILRGVGGEVHLRQQRVPLRGRQDELVTLYNSGAAIRNIATRLGSSYGAVRRALLDAGVHLRSPHDTRPLIRNDF